MQASGEGSPAHHSKIMCEINQLRQNSVLTDITLRAEDTAFPCHRVILASSCPYFHAMFSSKFYESQHTPGSVTIHNVTASAMKVVLDFIYTGVAEITNENVQQVFSAASLLLLQDLVNMCVLHLEENLDYDNCIGVYKLASAYSSSECSTLKRKAWLLAVFNFPDVAVSDDFLHLGEEELRQYLQEACRYLESCDALGGALLAWWRFHPGRHLCRVLRGLRLEGKITNYIFSQIPCDDPNAVTRENSSDLNNNGDFALSEDMLVLVGGFSCRGPGLTSRRNDRSVVCYIGGKKQWSDIPQLPCTDGGELTSASLHNNLIVVSSHSSVAWMYDISRGTWADVKGIGDYHRGYCLQAFKGYLYRVGGRASISCPFGAQVLSYDPVRDVWQIRAPMVHAVKMPSAVDCRGKLYVVGQLGEDLVIQSCRGVTEGWTVVASLKNSGLHFPVSTASLRDSIYIMCSKSTKAMCYTPGNGLCRPIAPMSARRHGYSAVVSRGKILVFGGTVGRMGVRSVEEYDPASDTWNILDTMPFSLSSHQSVKLKILNHQKL